MRKPSPGFEHESEKLERAAIKRRRDEEINWTPPRCNCGQTGGRCDTCYPLLSPAFPQVEKDVARMRWTDITDKETK